MSPTTEHQVLAYQHRCLRCDETWWTFTPKPIACSRCKSHYWDKPRVRALYPTKGAIRQRKWRKGLKAKARAERKAAKG